MLLNTLQGGEWDVSGTMFGHRDVAWLDGVTELAVTSGRPGLYFFPAIVAQLLDDFTAVHLPLTPLGIEYIKMGLAVNELYTHYTIFLRTAGFEILLAITLIDPNSP